MIWNSDHQNVNQDYNYSNLWKILLQTEVVKFEDGLEIDYINPTTGWTVVWLQDNHDNVVLTLSAHILEKQVVLNSKVNGQWRTEERPSVVAMILLLLFIRFQKHSSIDVLVWMHVLFRIIIQARYKHT